MRSAVSMAAHLHATPANFGLLHEHELQPVRSQALNGTSTHSQPMTQPTDGCSQQWFKLTPVPCAG